MRHDFPLTTYLVWLLKSPRTRTEAGEEARRLGIRLDYAEWYWRDTGR
jgi:hypothetical protein